MFKDFLTENGISHGLACPHTHEQVGMGERKHRQIFDMGLGLLAKPGLSLKFWSYVFAIIVHLINIIPSKNMGKKSPQEILFNKISDYKFLKIFRCLCFPNMRQYRSSKFSFMFDKCIFLGYSSSNKGCP